MYQNPHEPYTEGEKFLTDQLYISRYDPMDDTDTPQCRFGVPRLSTADPDTGIAPEAIRPRFSVESNVNGAQVEKLALDTNNFICDNHSDHGPLVTQRCWHIKLHVAYCECNAEYGDGMCSTNIEETSQETLVWVSAAPRLTISWSTALVALLPTFVTLATR